MERKIIQIVPMQSADPGYAPALYALCDDGSLFVAYDIASTDTTRAWKSLPNVPQPTED